MAKKKEKSQVINNIENLNLEIDYDKLAEAIVKAQEKCKEEKHPTKKVNFFKAVWLIIRNKEEKNGTRTAAVLASVMGTSFNGLAILCIVFIIGLIGATFYKLNWNGAPSFIFMQAATVAVFLAVLSMFAVIFRGIANEINAEKDRNYIVSVFSGLVSLAALIVALVALLKGVG